MPAAVLLAAAVPQEEEAAAHEATKVEEEATLRDATWTAAGDGEQRQATRRSGVDAADPGSVSRQPQKLRSAAAAAAPVASLGPRVAAKAAAAMAVATKLMAVGGLGTGRQRLRLPCGVDGDRPRSWLAGGRGFGPLEGRGSGRKVPCGDGGRRPPRRGQAARGRHQSLGSRGRRGFSGDSRTHDGSGRDPRLSWRDAGRNRWGGRGVMVMCFHALICLKVRLDKDLVLKQTHFFE